MKQTDRFSHPPEAWRPDRKGRTYPDQWHLTVSTRQPSTSALFVTVLQPCPRGRYDKLRAPELIASGGTLTVKVPVAVEEGRPRLERAVFSEATGRLLEVTPR